jgi:magnesium transporter
MADYATFEFTVDRIRAALEDGRFSDAVNILLELHPADQAEVFNLLTDAEQDILLPGLDASATADLLEEMEDDEVLDAVEGLSTERLADVLDEMEPDEAADLIGDLSPTQASEVLAQMEDVDEVLPLLGYPDETAGGLMTTWFIALRRHTTAEQAIAFLRDVSPDTEVPYYLYVVDRQQRLLGVVGLRDLVVASPQTQMESILDPEVIFVEAGVDQEEAARVMVRYDLTSLPVVDEQKRLLGIITHDDILDVLEDEATEDMLRMGGIETRQVIDTPYWDQRITQVVRSRFVWLLLLFVAGTFTGTVLHHFEDQLTLIVALTFFIPLLIGTGGNAGQQTIAMVIRAIALREVHPKDASRVWWREARAGLLLGSMLGSVAIAGVYLWSRDIRLALTVGITVAAICTWSNSVASLVPLLTSRLGIDPTVVSGPLMTTLIDGTGLIIYFTLAGLIYSIF